MLNLTRPLNAVAGQRNGARIFKYIIVIDLEATCYTRTVHEHEIIEFPAVLLNLVTGKIEAEFRQYVTPLMNPQLTRFCTELTGIRQEQVNAGVSLSNCLLLFDKWLKTVLAARNLFLPRTNPNDPTGNVAFATWTNWDLGECLSKDCARNQIRKPAYFDLWIDVKSIYMNFYKRCSDNLSEALSNMGLIFEGREHCGLDDSRNLAKMIVRMFQDGARFEITNQ
ncbi:ERI1 exoribonuclease 2-like [Wyeomyia smithii]|uniref:ERI1 exoribonuclease 2-like n=1 Tax=Wyeomyia smithii TaxID=174621 RepID=UPI0024680F6E|nr:ERI1 exoribonuclease 2-like [Wyeomyia smithii]